MAPCQEGPLEPNCILEAVEPSCTDKAVLMCEQLSLWKLAFTEK